MAEQKEYLGDEVGACLKALMDRVANLENRTERDRDLPENVEMRLKEKVVVNGRVRWIDGYSKQQLLDNYVKLLVREGVVEMVEDDDRIPMFGAYLKTFYATFKQKQQSNTVINRNRIIKNHILPRYEFRRIDKISTTDLQTWFNELGKKFSLETALKIKNTMNPVFEAAVEDEIITRNPLASKRLELTGKDTVSHKAISATKMAEIRSGLKDLPERERYMGALLCYTGMRFEEVLGVRWEDISDGWIAVERAVVHPTRNFPEVKNPKTKSSTRRIPASDELLKLLDVGEKHKKGYILAKPTDKKNETPLSYSEARRSFDKIRKQFGIEEYSAHDFRDTCATEWREKGIPLDVIARLLGHSKTETTE